MKKVTLTVMTAAAIALASATGVKAADLKVGDKAPIVQGTDQDGNSWDSSQIKGKKSLILYFYPKDSTPGCTAEACGLRDRMEELKKADVEVVGVSFDSAQSHKNFIAKYNLNFTLLADKEGKIADSFNARKPDGNVAKRISFLIGKDGVIRHITDSPKADVHLEELKEAVSKLK